MTEIRLVIDDQNLIAELADNAASRDFLTLLPLTLKLTDYASAEKVASLPKALATKGCAAGFEPSRGDVTYYAPWGNLAIFYRDFGYASGLVNLGRITAGLVHLIFQGPKQVVIECLTPNK